MSKTGPTILGDDTKLPRDTGPIVVPTSSPAWVIAGLAVIVAAIACGLMFLDRREMVAAAQEARAAADKEIASARAASAEKEARIAFLDAERSMLAEQKREQEAELARLKATQQALAERVSSEIITGDITLTQDGSKLTVDLVDKLLFDSGQAEINPRGKEVLERLGGVLAKVDDRIIQVVGHTDDAPPTAKIQDRFPTNWELSVARATNVVRFLADSSKVQGKRLVAVGRGQFEPVASNSNAKGRSRNRRIEILLMPLVVGRSARTGPQWF